ncbi:uncharacterized protein PF14_0093, partial [Oryzias melastigma]|uniref:uncharacterized protein PF14_0093 n=1 Tax=Oryzias melastigma TaxID=30732 RepID=UPI000CF7B43E
MPRKGKRSQAAKARWLKVSVDECENDSQNIVNNSITDEQHCELLNPLEYDIEVQHPLNPGDCVQASHSQNSLKYLTFSRNKQCTCNSLIFLAFLHENENITTADLDIVLDKGNTLYCEQRQKFPNNIYLAFDELPDIVPARANVYHINMQKQSRFGSFKDPVPLAANDYLDLTAGLSCLLSDVKYALLIMSNLCIAVFRTHAGQYGFFDPHDRTRTGMPILGTNAHGTAIMLTFANLQKMTDTLVKCFQELGVSSSTVYELKPVEFHPSSVSSGPNYIQAFQSNDDVSPSYVDKNMKEDSNTKQPGQNIKTPETTDSQAACHDDVSNGSDIDSLIQTLFTLLPSNQSSDKVTNNIGEIPQENIDKPTQTFNDINTFPDNMKVHMSKLNKNRRKKFLRLKMQCENNDNLQNKDITKDKCKTKKRLHSKLLYHTNPNVRQRKKNYINNLYASTAEFRQKQKQLSMRRYQNKAEVREKQRNYIIENYKHNPKFRDKQKRFINEHYKNDEDFNLKQKKFITSRYKNSLDFRNKQKQYIAGRYHTDSVFREKHKIMVNERNTNSDVKQKKRDQINKRYRSNPDFKQKKIDQINQRYRTNPNFKQKKIDQINQRYR